MMVACPDCGQNVPRADVKKQSTWRGIDFFECPKCAVGSPREQWKFKAARTSRAAAKPERKGKP